VVRVEARRVSEQLSEMVVIRGPELVFDDDEPVRTQIPSENVERVCTHISLDLLCLQLESERGP